MEPRHYEEVIRHLHLETITHRKKWVDFTSIGKVALSKFPLLFLSSVREAVMVVTKVTWSFTQGNSSIIDITLHGNIVANFL